MNISVGGGNKNLNKNKLSGIFFFDVYLAWILGCRDGGEKYLP